MATYVWTNWTATADTSSCTSNDVIWTTWTGSTTDCTASVWYDWNAAGWTLAPTREETAEERTARQAHEAEQRAERERIAAERAEMQREAKAKADALLQENLTEQQRAQLVAHRYFEVESRESKRRYRVKADKGKHGNIVEIDENGREVVSLCAAPNRDVPEGDYLLSQKLWLEHAEDEFRRVANHRRLV